jgi:hypothetical protein
MYIFTNKNSFSSKSLIDSKIFENEDLADTKG